MGGRNENSMPLCVFRKHKAKYRSHFNERNKERCSKYTWNYVDNKIGAVITQAGILEGIQTSNHTPLFFIPYVSGLLSRR
jgi:hypothetical protein